MDIWVVASPLLLNNAAINNFVHMSFCIYTIITGIHLQSRIAGHEAYVSFW